MSYLRSAVCAEVPGVAVTGRWNVAESEPGGALLEVGVEQDRAWTSCAQSRRPIHGKIEIERVASCDSDNEWLCHLRDGGRVPHQFIQRLSRTPDIGEIGLHEIGGHTTASRQTRHSRRTVHSQISDSNYSVVKEFHLPRI